MALILSQKQILDVANQVWGGLKVVWGVYYAQELDIDFFSILVYP